MIWISYTKLDGLKNKMKELYENILIYNYLNKDEEDKKKVIADWYLEKSKFLPFDEKLIFSNIIVNTIINFIDSCEFYEQSLKSFLRFTLIQDMVDYRYPRLNYLHGIEYMDPDCLQELSKFCLIDTNTLKGTKDKDLIDNISSNLKKINTLNFYYDKEDQTTLELSYALLPFISKSIPSKKSKDLKDVLYLINTYL